MIRVREAFWDLRKTKASSKPSGAGASLRGTQVRAGYKNHIPSLDVDNLAWVKAIGRIEASFDLFKDINCNGLKL